LQVTEGLLSKTEVFQARAAATENGRSPSVDRRVDVTTRVGVAADRR